MVHTPTHRRPTLRFETVLPTPSAALPRMDVAAFVGFASSGPLDTPVLVEDAAAFRDVFGGPVSLAWDAARSAAATSQLAAAVDAFFENGGRRAWVVRVAGRAGRTRAAAPIAHAFVLAGLTAGEAPATARARCEGSWCEGLAVSAFEVAEPLGIEAFFPDAAATALGSGYAGRAGFTLRPGSPEPIPGDVCRLVFEAEGITIFVEADVVVTAGGRRHVLAFGPLDCFRHRATLPLAAVTAVTRRGAASADPWPLPDSIQEVAGRLALEYAAGALPEVAVGDLLVVAFADGRTARLTVTAVDLGLAGGVSAAVPARVESRAAYWPISEASALGAVTGATAAARLGLGLAVFEGDAVASVLAGLGLSERHPRFFGRLPTDRALFAPQSLTRLEPVEPELRAMVMQPRFALAGPNPAAPRYLPMGLPPGPLPAFARTTLAPGAAEDRLVRDGLDVFGAELFLDDRLTQYGSRSLLGTAQHLIDVAGLDLEGLHALVPVQEVSMLAVPDAVQRSWRRAVVEPIAVLGAPVLDNQPPGSAVVVWSAVLGAARYRLEISEVADFEAVAAAYTGPALSQDVTPTEDCARLRYYRVRAETDAEAGPWSNTIALRLPHAPFAPCSEWRDEVPTLGLAGSPPSSLALTWTRSPPVADERWALEESAEPGFLGPTTIYSGPQTSAQIPFGPEGPRYFRVRAVRGGVVSAWSNTVTVLVDSRRPAFVLEPQASWGGLTQDELLAVHRAMLRFAAARADTTAALSGPEHLRADDAAAYVRRLVLPGSSTGASVSVAALTEGERGDLAHGAILTPWVISGAGGALSAAPPDGVVLGSIARRTISRGAWIAPANQPLTGILGATPRATRADNDRAIAAAVNVIEADPRGFVLRTAYTLSSDEVLADLSVARLLHLVRRWLSQLGQAYVFEPNGPRLAARVQDDLERALGRLWALGALAGARPSEAFEVVTGARLNDPRSRAAGRFAVEVRIAPSRPLNFLLIRLIETDRGGLGLQVS